MIVMTEETNIVVSFSGNKYLPILDLVENWKLRFMQTRFDWIVVVWKGETYRMRKWSELITFYHVFVCGED